MEQKNNSDQITKEQEEYIYEKFRKQGEMREEEQKKVFGEIKELRSEISKLKSNNTKRHFEGKTEGYKCKCALEIEMSYLRLINEEKQDIDELITTTKILLSDFHKYLMDKIGNEHIDL